MARAPDPRVSQARELFLAGKKLVEISEALGVPEGTVRSWKNRYGWNNCNKNATKVAMLQSKRSVAKKSATENKAVAEAVDHVMENPDLTDKQRLFCVLYIRCFNATKAYQKAYGCRYEIAVTEGPALLRNPRVKKEITSLKQARLNQEMLDESDIFQKYMDIAFADITDFVEFGREKVQVMGAFGPVEVKNPDTGEKVPLMKEVNTVRFRESDEVDGTLIAEVKQGKDGASLKLSDRLKALNWLADHMGMATPEQKVRIETMRARIGAGSEEEVEDDGFLEALKGVAAEDWKESEVEDKKETSI